MRDTSTAFCPFSTLYPPSPSFFVLPFRACSVYLYCSSLLVGLVFPTFSLCGTRQGVRLERKASRWSGLGGRKRRWMQNRLRDGGREGAKTVPEQGNGELNLPSQRGLARRYLTYYFTRAYLKSLFRDEIQTERKMCSAVPQNGCRTQSKVAIGGWQNFN